MNYKYFKSINIFSIKLAIILIPLGIYKGVDYFKANQYLWVKLFAVFFLFFYLLKSITKEEIKWKQHPLNLPIFLFFIICSLSLILSKIFFLSLKDYLIFFSYLILFFTIVNSVDTEKGFFSIINFFLYVSTIVALYVILHFYGIITYLKEFGPTVSPIGQKNWTSNYLALFFFITFFLFLIQEKRKFLFKYFLILIIFYIALMICRSRGIWISMILTLIIMVFLIYHFKLYYMIKKKKKWIYWMLIFFIIITVIYSTDNPINRSAISVTDRAISTFDPEDKSINSRFLMWRSTLDMIKDNPITGMGIGTFKKNYLNYQAKKINKYPELIKYWVYAGKAHNDYLQMGAELGLVGLAIFFYMLFKLYYLFFFFFFREKNENTKLIGFGLMIGISCFLIDCLFTFPLFVPALGSSFFMTLGLTVLFLNGFNLPFYRKKIL